MKKFGRLALVFLFASAQFVFGGSKLGIFSKQADIGSVAKPGSVSFDSAKGEYLIAGGGENMWFTNDAFHFVWEKMSGDFTLTADIRWIGTNGNPHRKACLLVRQSLDANSAYADVAVHGSGLTALQYRETTGDTTHEVQSDISAPARVRLEKRGDYISMWLAPTGGELKPAGGYVPVPFKGKFYVGLGVCAHDNKAIEQAVFSNVELKPVSTSTNAATILECSLETVAVASTDRSVVYRTRDHIEAPNWSRDGKYFLFNSNGRIYKLPVKGGTPEALDTGKQIHCNNDHGISPDGTQFAVSDQTAGGKSRIYLLPIDGGAARQITPLAPSYWHGWSPDGKTLAYCAERNGEFDIYTMPVDGGEETRLTTATGLDDGPDYSPDGKYIYFNSERTGTMQIWRMKPDGSEQEQITSDDYNSWFAHPSPNGQSIVFISFAKDVKGHPANQDVMLRLMSLSDRKVRVLAKLFGGQGTINVSSWSPDSKNVAFVSYQLVYP
jgi:TolB protein